jgi:hypothetical protein
LNRNLYCDDDFVCVDCARARFFFEGAGAVLREALADAVDFFVDASAVLEEAVLEAAPLDPLEGVVPAEA